MGEHAGLVRQLAAFEQVARRARGDDVFPGRAAAARTGDDVIKGEVVGGAGAVAVLALKAIAQEDVEARKGRVARGLDVGLQRDDGRQPHRQGGRVHDAVILLDDVDAVHEHGLDRVLP